MFTHALVITAMAACSGGAIGERNLPPAIRAITCVESSELRSAALRSRPSATSVVLCTLAVMRVIPSNRTWADMRTCPCTHSNSNPVATPSPVQSSASGVAGSSTRRASPWWRSPAGSRKRTVSASVASLGGLDDPLHLDAVEGRRAARGVHGRVDDPERRRRRVLRRTGRVGIEGVALHQQRLDELVEVRGHPASPSSAATSASNVWCPSAARRRCRASSVSGASRIQPPPG